MSTKAEEFNHPTVEMNSKTQNFELLPTTERQRQREGERERQPASD